MNSVERSFFHCGLKTIECVPGANSLASFSTSSRSLFNSCSKSLSDLYVRIISSREIAPKIPRKVPIISGANSLNITPYEQNKNQMAIISTTETTGCLLEPKSRCSRLAALSLRLRQRLATSTPNVCSIFWTPRTHSCRRSRSASHWWVS